MATKMSKNNNLMSTNLLKIELKEKYSFNKSKNNKKMTI